MASKNQLLTPSGILEKSEKNMLFLLKAHKEIESQEALSKIDISDEEVRNDSTTDSRSSS